MGADVESHGPILGEIQGVFPRRDRKDWRKQRGGGHWHNKAYRSSHWDSMGLAEVRQPVGV